MLNLKALISVAFKMSLSKNNIFEKNNKILCKFDSNPNFQLNVLYNTDVEVRN